MIDKCPYCKRDFNKKCRCWRKKMRSHMIDSSIFLRAYEEKEFTKECKLLLEGAKKRIYIGHVSTIILGELMKKLLAFKKEAGYRYDAIHKDLIEQLLNFKILFICDNTIKDYYRLGFDAGDQSQDRINLGCARANKIRLFIMLDKKFY